MNAADLADHRQQVEAALATARAAPLSKRRAMLAALLLDAHAERLLALEEEAGDLLAFRQRLAAAHPPLALLFALAALDPAGPRFEIATVAVPLEAFPQLSVADFMVSLYNDHTVQRLQLVLPDGTRHDAQAWLQQAAAAILGISSAAAPMHD